MGILVKTGLVDLLSTLPVISPVQQLGAWATQNTTHNRVTQILSSLGKRVTNAQAKRLNELGLSFKALQDLRSTSKDSEEFSMDLLDSGIRSKPLCDKTLRTQALALVVVVLLQHDSGALSGGSLALEELQSQLVFNITN